MISLPIQLAALSLAATLPMMAQAKRTAPQPIDAAWAKMYATDCGNAMKHPCPPSTNGYENEFNGDPRLPELLRRALPQRESWWVNGYAGSAPVSSIVQDFLGIPGELIVDDDRYVTATGCVPHDCTTHGLLWIDTGTHPATVIFVAEDLFVGGHESGYHLYLYTSRELATYYAGRRHIGMLPAEFLATLAAWHASLPSKYDPQNVVLATIIWPNGRTHDHFWSDLLPKTAPPDNTTGAKQ